MEIVVRSAAAFVFLWLVTRALGKRELAEMTAFELVLLVMIGDLIQQGVTQEDMSITGAFLTVGTISLLVVATAFVGFTWKKARTLIEGMPVVIVRDGKIMSKAARLERLYEEEIIKAARERGIADLSEVRVGILEADGRFSFLTGGDQQDDPETDHRAS